MSLTKIDPTPPGRNIQPPCGAFPSYWAKRMGWDAKGFVLKNHTTSSFWKSGYQQQSSGRFMGHSGFGKHDPSDGNKSYEIDLCHGARCISWTPAAQRSHHFCFLGTSSCRYPGWQWSLATEVRRKRKRPGLDFIEKKNGLTMFDCWDRDPNPPMNCLFFGHFHLELYVKGVKGGFTTSDCTTHLPSWTPDHSGWNSRCVVWRGYTRPQNRQVRQHPGNKHFIRNFLLMWTKPWLQNP